MSNTGRIAFVKNQYVAQTCRNWGWLKAYQKKHNRSYCSEHGDKKMHPKLLEFLERAVCQSVHSKPNKRQNCLKMGSKNEKIA